jgi:hypothetical protein
MAHDRVVERQTWGGGLPDGVCLHLQPNVSFEVEGELIVALHTPCAVYPFEGDDAILLGRCLPAFDGSRSLIAVAKTSGVAIDGVRAIALSLYSAGLLAEDSSVAVDPLLFYEHARAAALLCSEAATTEPAIAQTASSEAKFWLVLGTLIEHWHYVKTAPARLAIAARQAECVRARQLWMQLAAEEAAWSQGLESGLCQVLTVRQLACVQPLPGTAELCGQMYRTAWESQLGYAACVAAAFPVEESSAGLLTYYRYLSYLDTVPEGVIGPFVRYAEAGAEHARRDPLRVIFADRPPLQRDERRAVLRHLADHVRALARHHRNVLEFYGRRSRLHLSPEGENSWRSMLAHLLYGEIKELWTILQSYRPRLDHLSSRAYRSRGKTTPSP